MKAVYFIEKDGVKHYKCDTFWSTSANQKNAKIHSDSIYDQDRFFESATYPISKINENTEEKTKDFFDNSIYGYQSFDDDALLNEYSIKEDYNLPDPTYLKLIKFTENGFDVIDYKQILREEKINTIMK